MSGMQPHRWTAEQVVARLQDAGTTMQQWRVKGCWPAGYGQAWPDVVRDAWEAYDWRDGGVVHVQPTAASLHAMEEAVSWLLLIPSDQVALRRIVWSRSLLHPGHGGYRYSWRLLARMVDLDKNTVQHWYGRGIAIVVACLNGEAYVEGRMSKAVRVNIAVDTLPTNRVVNH